MILKGASGDPILGHGSYNMPYNSHVITVKQFLDYLETCGKQRTNPRRHFRFPCSVRTAGSDSAQLPPPPCVWRKTSCVVSLVSVTNTGYNQLLNIRD